MAGVWAEAELDIFALSGNLAKAALFWHPDHHGKRLDCNRPVCRATAYRQRSLARSIRSKRARRGAHQHRKLTLPQAVSDQFTGDNRREARFSEMNPALIEPFESSFEPSASCASELAELAKFGDADSDGGCCHES
jgi:hypothetical protein